MSIYDPNLARLVSDVVTSTLLPTALADLDSASQRQLRRDAEALSITAETNYAAIRERQFAERVNASAVADALAAARSRVPSTTRSRVV